MRIVLQILLYAAAIYTADGLCNVCSAVNGVACVANDQFEVCANGIPVPPAVSCPSGTICSATEQVCSPVGTVPPSCDRCGACSSTNVFACITYNTFAFCFGGDTPDTTTILTCPGTTVCNIDASFFCVDPAVTGIGATCPLASATTFSTTSSTTPSTTSTTASPATGAQAYCASVATSGRFEVTTDPTCRSYIYCALVNSTWIGQVYQCPGVTLFNPTSRLCGVGTPARCL